MYSTSTSSALGKAWPWCRTVVVRDAADAHRQCTPLELLFDLCFVVSVAALVVQLHHAVVGGRAAEGALSYALLFLPICWAWMLFSWFASAFDNDDVVYRLLTLGQMAGVLALAATIPAAFEGDSAPFVATYAVMRLPLIAKWLRAAVRRTAERRYAVRYTAGLSGCQLGWVALLALPEHLRLPAMCVLMVVELALPAWASASSRRQMFHERHIGERFGLFIMIVIGESILAVSTALTETLQVLGTGPLVVIGAATLLSAFCVWWLYFDVLDGRAPAVRRHRVLWWGHGHLPAFGAIGAMGAGAEVAVQVQAEALEFTTPMQLAVVLPAAVALLALAWVRSMTAGAQPLVTVTRVLAAGIVVAAGLYAGASGPAATAATVAAVLVLQAVGETLSQGVLARRAVAALPLRRIAAPAIRRILPPAGERIALA